MNEAIDRLILKQPFEMNGEARSNTLKLNLLPDGNIQVYISNGDHRGYFRLYEKEQKELMEFLQRNIK
jgi:hypothetical protein